MATWLEEAAQNVTQLLGGWSAGDEVTGSGDDAYMEAAQVLANISSARDWDSATLSESVLLIDYALQVSPDDAELFWQALAQSWPSKPTVSGWDSTGDVWDSYADSAAGTFEDAVAVVQDTARDAAADIASPLEAAVEFYGGVDVAWLDVGKAALVGGVVGLGMSWVTGLNANVAAGLGALGGGVWNLSNQTTD